MLEPRLNTLVAIYGHYIGWVVIGGRESPLMVAEIGASSRPLRVPGFRELHFSDLLNRVKFRDDNKNKTSCRICRIIRHCCIL